MVGQFFCAWETQMTPDTIRDLQHRLGLSDRALADLCGVAERAVRYWKQRGDNKTKPGSAATAILAMLENGTHPHVSRTKVGTRSDSRTK
jgi:DNA-binding transcriptional regulator YiaG